LFTIDFEPVGRRGECSENQSLLECARSLSVNLVSECSGMGVCKKCKVRIISGTVTKPVDEELSILTEHEQNTNYRLACRAYPLSDVKVLVPPESLVKEQNSLVKGPKLNVALEPSIQSYDIELNPPSLRFPEADDRNLLDALNRQHVDAAESIDLKIMQSLSSKLREMHWKARVALRDKEVIAFGAPATRWLGLAADIGTTTIAVYLMDMESGKTIATKGLMNPQISYGEDVVSRIFAAGRAPENAELLQSLLVDAIQASAASLCSEVGADPSDIVEAVMVGNTAIHHLFLRLPVCQMGVSPYVPAVRSAVDIKARDLGLQFAGGAYVHLLPNIAGYVGADHVSMLLATRMVESGNAVLAIDIGTNTEICLNHRGRLTSVSCASGPAFEGAHIKFGMRAAPGAIEHVTLTDAGAQIQTIGNKPPAGICGSGLLDAVAQLLLHGIMDRTGRLGPHARLRNREGINEFVLAEIPGQEAITISQKDIRSLQLAKAAIRLGIRALLEAEGLSEDFLEQVIIAGAFGTYIDVESAVTIGMLPRLPLERFKQVGNAAGTGACMALISRTQRLQAQQIAARDGYIELATIPDFNRKFAEASSFDSEPSAVIL
jgi:uncharacterized 2Fe-2S/4Fe-4S cluster protein (DUF4445 family)